MWTELNDTLRNVQCKGANNGTMARYQARSAGRPFPFFGHKTVMKTYPPKACKTIDQGSGYMYFTIPDRQS